MRLLATALILATLTSAPAAARSLYYGPKSGPFGTGFKQNVEKDGSIRIVTEYHSRDPDGALGVALYRAAELAHWAGKPYVQILGGSAWSRHNVASAFVYALPADTSAAPPACRRARQCYTADVAQVLRALSGPSGNEPGVARPIGVDEFGRTVTMTGFGVGAVAWLKR